MKNLFVLSAMMMAFVCSGCGDSRDSVTAASMANMKEMIATLETIKDGPTAKAAKPKLASQVKQMNDLKARQAKLGEPTEAEMKSMMEKYGNEMEELQRKMAAVGMRIQFDPAIQAELKDLDMKMR